MIISTNDLFFSFGFIFRIKGKWPTIKSGHDKNRSWHQADHSQKIQSVKIAVSQHLVLPAPPPTPQLHLSEGLVPS